MRPPAAGKPGREFTRQGTPCGGIQNGRRAPGFRRAAIVLAGVSSFVGLWTTTATTAALAAQPLDHEPCGRPQGRQRGHDHHPGLADLSPRCGPNQRQCRHHPDPGERSVPPEEVHRGHRRHHRGRAGDRERRRLHRLLGRYEYAMNANTGAVIWKTFLGTITRSAVRPPETGDHLLRHGAQRRRVRGRRQRQQRRGAVVCAVGRHRRDHVERSHRPRSGRGRLLQLVEPADRHRSRGWAAVRLHRHRQRLRRAAGPGPAPEGVAGDPQWVGITPMVPTGQVGGGIWTSPTYDVATNKIFVSTGTLNLYSQTLSQALVAINATTMAVVDHWQLPLRPRSAIPTGGRRRRSQPTPPAISC